MTTDLTPWTVIGKVGETLDETGMVEALFGV
jgi:hypothetical protein